jgi:dihydroorotate dehydrogenase
MTDGLYRGYLRPYLFALDAEHAHDLTARILAVVHRSTWACSLLRDALAPRRDPALIMTLFNREFVFPVGLAAGFDKGATMYNALGAMGFGFVEVGTVTAHAQPGNDRPRLYRLPVDRAIVNRMGFNNPGAHAVAEAIRSSPPLDPVLGINLGKSKVTPLEEAPADYAVSARVLAPLADYLVINVSSPNTPGLRTLQSIEPLRAIVRAVRGVAKTVPLLVKIAPDLTNEEIDAVSDLALAEGLDGVVATNTTVSRAGLSSSAETIEAMGTGGLSGAPLRARATAVIGRVWRRSNGRLPVVGVGGVFTVDDAWEKVRAGASLIQVYTGLVYEGPTLPRTLCEGLSERLRAAGFTTLSAAVGSAHG